MKYQWKSIGNPVEISMKYQLKSIGNPVEIVMKYRKERKKDIFVERHI